jgi:hypothetical protein
LRGFAALRMNPTISAKRSAIAAATARSFDNLQA